MTKVLSKYNLNAGWQLRFPKWGKGQPEFEEKQIVLTYNYSVQNTQKIAIVFPKNKNKIGQHNLSFTVIQGIFLMY